MCADSPDDDRACGTELADPGGDVDELLAAEVGAEARLGDDDVGEPQRQPGSDERVAAVGDVRERPAVHEGGRARERLHEVRADRVAQQYGHRAVGPDVARGDEGPVGACADHHAPQALLQVGEVAGEAEHRHHLGSDGDVEAVLADAAVAGAEADDGAAQRPVVEVDHAPPRDDVEASGVAPVHRGCRSSRRAGCAPP